MVRGPPVPEASLVHFFLQVPPVDVDWYVAVEPVEPQLTQVSAHPHCGWHSHSGGVKVACVC